MRSGMYPLLVSGITSVTSHLLDSWSHASERKAETEHIKFQELLDRVAGPARTAGLEAVTQRANPIETRIAELRAQLLGAPEVSTTINAGDPSKPLTLQLDSDGRLVAQVPGGRSKTLILSTDNAALAKELARLLAVAPGAAGAPPSTQGLASMFAHRSEIGDASPVR